MVTVSFVGLGLGLMLGLVGLELGLASQASRATHTAGLASHVYSISHIVNRGYGCKSLSE